MMLYQLWPVVELETRWPEKCRVKETSHILAACKRRRESIAEMARNLKINLGIDNFEIGIHDISMHPTRVVFNERMGAR